jgi:hypothetical protein
MSAGLMWPDSRNVGNVIRESQKLTATAMLLTVSLALSSRSPHRYVELLLDVFRLSIIAGISSVGLHSFAFHSLGRNYYTQSPYFQTGAFIHRKGPASCSVATEGNLRHDACKSFV